MRRPTAPASSTRFSFSDAAEWAGDVGPDPRHVAVVFELERPLAAGELLAQVTARLRDIRVLNRIVETPDRWLWHARFRSVDPDPGAHLGRRSTDDPLPVAVAALVAERLPGDRPLWRIIELDAAGTPAIVFVAHHVLVDGPTASAIVAALLGIHGGVGSEVPPVPGRLRAAAARVASIGAPLAALSLPSPRTSLLAPITTGFELSAVEAGLSGVRSLARPAGGTVNDVLLAAVAGAIRAAGADRGERLARVVVSVPVTSPRRRDAAGSGREVRNEVGVLTVSVPPGRPGDVPPGGVARVAARTRWRKRLVRGYSVATPLAPLLALLGSIGCYRPFVDRQRAITTLATNLRGPSEPVRVAGVRVTRIIPVSPAVGNVCVVFTALSYADRFLVSVRCSPEASQVAGTITRELARGLGGTAVWPSAC